MRVVRTQWPVGQGCFASGIIDVEGRRPLHYVYDCGARNVTQLEPIVERYSDMVGKIDALFISHFDGDHVDGLDRLLARTQVSDVYLPYLDMATRVLTIVEEMMAGAVTATFIQAVLDPVRWLTDRGAERVIFVRNEDGSGPYSPPDTDPDGGGDPDSPVLAKADVAPISETKAGLTSDTDGFGTESHHSQIMEMKTGGAVNIVKGYSVVWVLVPYVPHVDPRNLKAFRKRVTDLLNLPEGSAIPAYRVVEQLKSDDGREALRQCYDEIITAGASSSQHNKISMSLYSGPVLPNQFHLSILRHRGAHWWMGPDEPHGGVGWIGAGDAKLKNGSYRNAWIDFYRQLLPMVGTFLLPHHGSKANWHSQLLRNVPATFFVAAADEADAGYKHPSAKVVDEIEHAGGLLIHVTKKPKSRFIEILSSF